MSQDAVSASKTKCTGCCSEHGRKPRNICARPKMEYKIMADPSILATCPEDQCQSSDERGNFCRLKRIEGSQYCAKHGGKTRERQLIQNYNLTRYKAELQSKLRSDSILSLREEIGVARITLEGVLNSCSTSTDLLMYQPKIVTLVQAIQKTTESCQRIEEKTNQLLSKATLLQFIDELLDTLKRHVPDHAVHAAISNEILLKLQRLDEPSA